MLNDQSFQLPWVFVRSTAIVCSCSLLYVHNLETSSPCGFYFDITTVASCLYPPSRISPLYIFSPSSCTGIFISQIGLPNHGHATKIATWSFVETPTLLSSRSLWSGNARTKPASTEQLRNLLMITSESASGVNAIAHWKDKPKECLENTAVYAVANLCQLILTTEFLEDKRSEGRSVLNQLL